MKTADKNILILSGRHFEQYGITQDHLNMFSLPVEAVWEETTKRFTLAQVAGGYFHLIDSRDDVVQVCSSIEVVRKILAARK